MATVNSYFWVGRLAEGGLGKALKPLERDADPMMAMGLPAIYERRIGHDVASLEAMTSTFSRWRRLLVLVMIASALERFLVAVSSVAVQSDPLLQPGFPKVVDGAQLKKRSLEAPTRDLSDLVVGEWSQRTAAFHRTFGSVPVELRQAEGDLEYIRKTRNRVAHALGVDDGYEGTSRTDARPMLSVLLEARRPDTLPRVRVSDDRLTALMGVVQKVVDSIDSQLLEEHVGAYELIATYLEWKANPDAFERQAGIDLRGHRRDHEIRFGHVLGELFGAGQGAAYIKSLKAYVAQL